MARESRPPGFDMTYRPEQRKSYGPPLRAWVLPVLYLAGATTLMTIVLAAPFASPESWLFRYVVEGDASRMVSARALAFLVGLGAIAALIRTGMRGVIVHPDGIEARYLVALGWPRVRSCSWVEIDELILGGEELGLGLWDGSKLWLPDVANRAGLTERLQYIAEARAIPIRQHAARVPSEAGSPSRERAPL